MEGKLVDIVVVLTNAKQFRALCKNVRKALNTTRNIPIPREVKNCATQLELNASKNAAVKLLLGNQRPKNSSK